MAESTRLLPVPDPDSAPFWEGCKAHALQAQRCSACGAFRWPPAGVCPRCYAWSFAWVPLSGQGVVQSYVVVHYVSAPAFKDAVPYVVAKIALDGTDGGVVMTSNLVDWPWDHVRVGMRVRPVFEDVSDEITLPKFAPL